MNEQGIIAKKYFEAFHEGKLDEVFKYVAEDGIVKYSTEAERSAKDFFPETKDMILQIKFETHGIYTSENATNVLIHFSYTMPSEDGTPKTVEAVDIVEFNDENKIKKITVIPNG